VKIVLATTARTRGGVWRHVADLADGLQVRGHRTVVALVPEAEVLRNEAISSGLAVADFSDTVTWRGWLWHGHLHDTFDRAFLRATLRRRLVGSTVLTEHLPRTYASDPRLQPGPRHPLAGSAKTLFKRLQYELADRVIAVSPSSKAFLSRRYGERWARIEVVLNGVAHAPAPAPVRQHEPPMRVVCIGSVIYQKGFDLLVDAAEVESTPPWRAAVVGEGPALAPLTRRAADRDVVRFLGWSSDVPNELAASDVVCMPSRWESAPYAALEAMNAGRPLVAFDVDGVREYVEQGVTGLLVEPENVDALAEALASLATNEVLRTEMGRAAYMRAGEFSRERMVDEVVRIYAAVATSGSRLGRRFRSASDPEPPLP
jgi:glycosyltransferase involved in cell wall biosynthesis